jgi:DNA-binding MarR family transcriptional regulator
MVARSGTAGDGMEATATRFDSAAGSLAEARLENWLRLRDLSRRIEAEWRDRLRRSFQWSLPRFEVMAALHRAGTGLRMSDLAMALGVSNGNVTALVDALVEDRLAVRVADPEDRRVLIVKPTAQGTEDFAEIAAAHARWIDQSLSGLDPTGLETLDALMATAREAFEALGSSAGAAARGQQAQFRDGAAVEEQDHPCIGRDADQNRERQA